MPGGSSPGITASTVSAANGKRLSSIRVGLSHPYNRTRFFRGQQPRTKGLIKRRRAKLTHNQVFVRNRKHENQATAILPVGTTREAITAFPPPRTTGGTQKGEKMSQNQTVLNHLEKYGSITPRDAYELYGIMRLGARIDNLKHMGHKIYSHLESCENRFGDKVRYARYTLGE